MWDAEMDIYSDTIFYFPYLITYYLEPTFFSTIEIKKIDIDLPKKERLLMGRVHGWNLWVIEIFEY
jgi:hypothetical protein